MSISTEQQAIRKFLSDKIKSYMTVNNLRQKQMADKLSVSRAVLESYVNQRATPRGQVLYTILQLSKISYEQMINEVQTILQTELANIKSGR